jgi:YD repeat-containing protein
MKLNTLQASKTFNQKKAGFTILKLTGLLSLTLLFVLTSCSKDDDNSTPPEPLSNAKLITSFQFAVANNPTLASNVMGVINETAKTVIATLPNGIDIENLTPTIEISADATISPNGAQNFSSPINYTVIAEDGSTAIYSVEIKIISLTSYTNSYSDETYNLTYNDEGQLTGFETSDGISGAKINNIITKNTDGTIASIGAATFTYNASGQIIEIDNGAGNGTTLLEYDMQGRLTNQTTDHLGGGITEVKIITYDVSGNISEVNVNTTASTDTYTKYVLSYNEENNISEVVIHTSDNGIDYIVAQTTVYTYDDKVNPLKIVPDGASFSNFYISPSFSFNLLRTLSFNYIAAYMEQKS